MTRRTEFNERSGNYIYPTSFLKKKGDRFEALLKCSEKACKQNMRGEKSG